MSGASPAPEGPERPPRRERPEPTPRKRPAYEPGAGLLDTAEPPPTMPRPASTVAGAAIVLLRVVAGIAWIASAAILWAEGQPPDILVDGMTPADAATLGIALLVTFGGGVLLIEAVFAVLVLRGSNLARVALLVLSTLSVAATFAGWWEEGQQVTIQTTLITLSLDILILLALSSRASAAWARRPREHRRRRAGRDAVGNSGDPAAAGARTG